MSERWRSGKFDRGQIHGVFHPFTPAHALDALEEVDLEQLKADGKKLILLDVDNTLVEWKQENFQPDVLEWLERAKSLGFNLCILSNTRRVERLMRITKTLGIETVRGRFKPSRAMYRLALIKFQCKASEAVMIGDQMMTDILGANRAGIDAIWVRQIGHKEFGGTKFNRFIERLLTSAIYAALVTPLDEQPGTPEEEAAKPVREKTIVHQIIRFGMVGATAFVVDYIVRKILLDVVKFEGHPASESVGHWLRTDFPQIFQNAASDQKAAAPIAFGIASLIAMTVSFFLNRKWTFEVRGKEQRMKQARRFYAISIGGYFINLAISATVFNKLPSTLTGALLISSLCGAAVGAVWNFLGSRYYAFKR